MAVIKSGDGEVSPRRPASIPARSTGLPATTWTGGLIGSVVGILGGPLGVLLGASIGLLTGSIMDANDADDDSTLILYGEPPRCGEGKTAIVALVQESDEKAFDLRPGRLPVHHHPLGGRRRDRRRGGASRRAAEAASPRKPAKSCAPRRRPIARRSEPKSAPPSTKSSRTSKRGCNALFPQGGFGRPSMSQHCMCPGKIVSSVSLVAPGAGNMKRFGDLPSPAPPMPRPGLSDTLTTTSSQPYRYPNSPPNFAP